MQKINFEAELYFSGVGVIPVVVTVTHQTEGATTKIVSVAIQSPSLTPPQSEALARKTQLYL